MSDTGNAGEFFVAPPPGGGNAGEEVPSGVGRRSRQQGGGSGAAREGGEGSSFSRDSGSAQAGPAVSGGLFGSLLPPRSAPGNGGRSGGDRSGGAQGDGVSGNLGFVRQQGPRRVVGATQSVASFAADGGRVFNKSYAVASGVQFNLVDEMMPDSISRDFAQEIVESLFFSSWGISSRDAIAMRKAEDVLFAFLIVRGASPFASYELSVMVGESVVEMEDLSVLLLSKEVTRRRFIRALADDLRKFIKEPENAILRGRIVTKLAINSQYAHLGFDGSTHCTGMNRNEVAFTKALESRNLFDDESVRGSLKNSSLLDGVFDSSGSGVRRSASSG